jgi:hypothetical protein
MKVCRTLRVEELVDVNWAEEILNNFHQTLKSKGFNFCEIRYSGFNSQGDGASFTFNSVDVERFIKINSCASKYKHLLKAINNGMTQLTFHSQIVNHFYAHNKTIIIEASKYISDNVSEKKCIKINNEIIELQNEIEEKYISLCDEIYKELEQAYYGLVENIEEDLKEEEETKRKNEEIFKKYNGELVKFQCLGKFRPGLVIGYDYDTTCLRIATPSGLGTATFPEFGIVAPEVQKSFLIILPIKDCEIIITDPNMVNDIKAGILAAFNKRYGDD